MKCAGSNKAILYLMGTGERFIRKIHQLQRNLLMPLPMKSSVAIEATVMGIIITVVKKYVLRPSILVLLMSRG